ncbi:hypothetical protein [Alicyclobacillus sp. SO9]|uniref:hypothetical protein n=1 Tax=Alicyclobacillus sp. SO9 TaxID=2665646 RepID=UPI0018E8D3F7|nr:hypothetical protein [Alicyclobacillus sp. SO9]QQE77758.1 hypothetical protein GI364_17750 [Alicyclobacillus sp. SO9]
MQSYVEDCKLLNEQRNVILLGIKKGKEQFQSIRDLLPEFTTRTFAPRMQYDCVNTHVENEVQRNSHLQLKIFKRRAGFHPYLVIQDMVRNIFILVSKLPKSKYIYEPSGYRGDFASSNISRLMGMGASFDQFEDTTIQSSLPLGTVYQPFGVIVSYDGDSDTVYEGALYPDQSDWIYKDEITDSIVSNTEEIVRLPSYQVSDIETPLKSSVSDSDIVVKLKDDTSSS